MLYSKYKSYTMIPEILFLYNLIIAQKINGLSGAIIECGVWRGGMIAGLAEYFGPLREYYLFDSFEGLPAAKSIDGSKAIAYQQNKNSDYYYDNCKAEIEFAQKAMKLSGVDNFKIIKGWFSDTLPNTEIKSNIAILRLDGDWYESTYVCLENLFPGVAVGGIIIIDDYFTWDGCSKAVHDYLSKNKRPEKIRQFNNSIAYIIKE